MKGYLGVDQHADDPELGYLDVLCFFFVSFLDMNAAVRKGSMPAGEARYVEDALLDALDPDLAPRIRRDVAPLLHEPGGDIPEALKQRVETLVSKAKEALAAISTDFREKILQTQL
jgi:hypothetical protein